MSDNREEEKHEKCCCCESHAQDSHEEHKDECHCGCHSHDEHCDHNHKDEHECGCEHGHKHGHEHGGCGCGCHHHHDENPRKKIALIVITILLLIGAVMAEKAMSPETWQLLIIYLVPYLLIGHETLHEAWEGIRRREPFNEHFLMTIATVGAMGIGFLPGAEPEFAEAVFVMLFFQIGELFEGYAEGRSRDSIAHLMDIRPDSACVERNGSAIVVAPEDVSVGETIVVKPGERIPLDGVITEGHTSLNTVALTGESVPRDADVDDTVISGCINLSGVIRMRVTKDFGESTVSKIINLVENAGERKSRSETFIARFAKVYTPIVVYIALALAIIPPVMSGDFAESFPVWLNRALTFLVVSCPCALVISVPLTFFGGIGGASRKGILVKGASFMDILAKVDTVVMDKTGTLTHGVFDVDAVHSGEGCDTEDKERERHLLHLAAHVEQFSSHPIALALRSAFPESECDGCKIENVEEIAGHGIRATVNGEVVCVGNSKMMESLGITGCDCHKTGTIVHVAISGEYAGHIIISDRIKEDSAEAIGEMRRQGVNRTVMLTGDRKAVGESVAQTLGIDECHTELLPADKVDVVEDILRDKAKVVAFAGDGINDAPVLARADVGIAMGGLGSDAAIEAADIVIMDDKPSKIALAIGIARRTIGIARQNVAFAIGVKIAVLVLAAFGAATMWMAVFADVGVTVLAVLNAMRALRA